MVSVSNIVLAIFNWITLIIGLGAMAMGLYFVLGDNSTACQNGLEDPLFITGAALAVISLLGLIGTCCRANFVLIIYLIVMFLLIVGLIMFTLFTIFVTNKSVGGALTRARIFDFQNWLRNHFVESKNWVEIKSCLMDANVCNILGAQAIQKAPDLYRHFSGLQSGCCKPPSSCGFVQQNATSWARPKTGPVGHNRDCIAWSNSPHKLCFDCETCKVGFVDGIRKQWKYLAIFNACVTVLAIVVYSIGCCAKRGNEEDSKYKKYKGYV